jgi:hypothetical protein
MAAVSNRMTAIFKILASIFLLFFVACNASTSSQNKSNIEFDNGHFIIDTNAIVTNRNLQSLLEELENQDLFIIKTRLEIPVCIKSFLDSLTGTFLIANPGEQWQVGCSPPIEIDYSIKKMSIDSKTGDTILSYSLKDTTFPKRQLNYFGMGKEIALMKYYSGGIGKMEHILIFKFAENKVVDFWSGNGQIFKDDATKEEIIHYLKDNKNKHWGLNTNMIYL